MDRQLYSKLVTARCDGDGARVTLDDNEGDGDEGDEDNGDEDDDGGEG